MAADKSDLPTSEPLWRWHIELEHDDGKRWHKSVLLPLAKAKREADAYKYRTDVRVTVEEDAVAVEKWRARIQKQEEIDAAMKARRRNV